ncbi:MAG TPA: hypothetical protein VLV18_11150 [Terriglobales bacterium]|nr:hypothetical protein [Terriglobales bacterium]
MPDNASSPSPPTEIVDTEPQSLVSPADPKRVLKVMRRFEETKRQVLTSNDFVVLETGREKRPYIKKSGWMKYALACELSLEKRDERVEETAQGRIYHYTYRSIAPNGRFADAVGSASTTERNFTHPDHDARALVQTRACNRAISNLVAGGEVSAEEMVSDIQENRTTKTENAPADADQAPAKQAWNVPIIKDQATQEWVKRGLRQFPLGKGLKSVGMINVLNDELSIVPEKPIKIGSGLVDGFLLRKVIEPLVAKNHFAYAIQRTGSGLLEAVLIRGLVVEPQVREMIGGARWAFEKALEEGKP